MQVAHKTINVTGLGEIFEFLAKRHKLGGDHFTSSMLNAWADDAEAQMAEGNPASIELKSWESVSGHTELFTVSDAGITTTMIEVD